MSAAKPATRDFGALAGLSGFRRAALLLVVLGPEISAQVLRGLPEAEVEHLVVEISRIGAITDALRHDILQSAYADAVGGEEKLVGGLEYSQELLRRALGDQRAEQIMGKISVN